MTLAAPDRSFEVHVDASEVTEATLGISEKTGRGVMRILGKERRTLLTVLLMGEDANEHFKALLDRWGSSVTFDA